jgi:trimeric autotransporter adhesin
LRADEKLTAFLELEAVIRAGGELARRAPEILAKLGSKSGGGRFPAGFFAPSRPAINRINTAGEQKEGTMNPLIQLKEAIPVFLVGLACFALSPVAQALLPPPPPDGGYPNGNTAEGDFALFNLTTGFGNTANGASSLFGNTTGEDNTATGINALFNNSTGSDNTASGAAALASNTTGFDNTATGMAALVSNTTGSQNTATGADALVFNATGHDNTATGVAALFYNTTGSDNTATGAFTLESNTVGVNNTATGNSALFNNIRGFNNTATGVEALFGNATGSWNTANGFHALHDNNGHANTATGNNALRDNQTGAQNTATGAGALRMNTTGSGSTAVGFQALVQSDGGLDTAMGWQALWKNTSGTLNTAVGAQALQSNTNGFENTAIGRTALFNSRTARQNTAIGAEALESSTGSFNVALGWRAGVRVTTADGVISIGTEVGENVPGSCYIGNIFGRPSPGGAAVFINSDRKLGTTTSSRRFKEEIKPMERASEALFALKPVTFRYKKEIDPASKPQFGLIAEDVEAVNPDLVVRDKEGKTYSVRYDQVNAMLLNEFLKEHRAVQEQQKEIDALKAELKEQRSLIQKVNDKVELDKPAPQTVLNNQ